MTDLRIDRFNNAEQVLGHNTGSNPPNAIGHPVQSIRTRVSSGMREVLTCPQ
jgi:hypothetical protein